MATCCSLRWYYKYKQMSSESQSNKRFLRVRLMTQQFLCEICPFYCSTSKETHAKISWHQGVRCLVAVSAKSGYHSWLEPGEVLQFQNRSGNRDWTCIMARKKLCSIQTFNSSNRNLQIDGYNCSLGPTVSLLQDSVAFYISNCWLPIVFSDL